MKKVNELLTYGIILDLLVVVYEQHMIMLTELQKVLSHNQKCCVQSLPQYCQNEPYQKLWM